MKKLNAIICFMMMQVSVLSAGEPNCSGCDTAKLMLQCEYYVKIKGDLSKKSFCEEYADAVDNDGSHAKAAWYYLLGGKPDRALPAAKLAIDEGQIYAAEYAAEASLFFNEYKAAKTYIKMLRKSGMEPQNFRKNLELLKKIYPDTDFDLLLRME
ncbi:hypothetical protein NNO_1648 [Hydrogenimonas sp.]|nr:hypothetical protein NNO_1648 [Hydrogenimonas sp.]